MYILQDYDTALKLMSEQSESQLFLESKKQHIKLAPKYQGDLKTGISCHLTSYLLRYNKEFGGVPVAFKNIKVKQRIGKILYDQPCIHFDVEADFIIFKPTVGCTLKGKINKITQRHIGCLVHDCFNAWMLHSCETEKLAATKLMGTEVVFEVQGIHSKDNVLSLRGKLKHSVKSGLDQESDLIETEKPMKQKKRVKKKKDEKADADIAAKESTADDTVVATGVDDRTLEISGDLDNSELDPLISSTQIADQATMDKSKKHKKKKKKDQHDNCMHEGGENDSELVRGHERISESSVLESGYTAGGVDINTSNEGSQKKKKKKKHRSGEDSVDSSFTANGVADGVSNKNSEKFDKGTKKKRQLETSDGVVESKEWGDSKMTEEMFSPKKKFKLDQGRRDRSGEMQDSITDVDTSSGKKAKKKKKKKHKTD